MLDTARLIVPALRWDRAHGFRYLEGLIDDALELGVGGFLIEGGPRSEVAALAGRLHAGSGAPILIGARAERGAGETIDGLTRLPPFGALASVAVVHGEDAVEPSLAIEPVRRAARLTARELRNVGLNWALAPVCELDVLLGAGSPGSRSAGDDPAIVRAIVAEWIDACQAEAVLSTALQFSGTGRVAAPIEGAIDAGVAAVMVAGAQAPVERALRGTMGFEGLAVTALFDRDPEIVPGNEGARAVGAVAAGCDIVLAPGDLDGVVRALATAVKRGVISAARLRAARERIDRRAGWARPSVAREPSLDDVMWSRQLADSCARYVRGSRPRIGATLEVVVMGSGAQPVDHFTAVLRALHIEVTESPAPGRNERAPLALLWMPDAWLAGDVGREEIDRVRAVAKAAVVAGREVVVVAFAHPRAAHSLAVEASVLCAWDPSATMQEAAARSLLTLR